MFKDKKYDPSAAWRSEPASIPQLQLLASLNISLPANATKGQASDLISRATSPNDEQIEFLQFFDVPLPSSATELDAKNRIMEIIANPANRTKWDARPATSQQQEIIAYVDGSVPPEISLLAADKLIRSYAKDENKTKRYYEVIGIFEQHTSAEIERQNRLSFLYDHCQTLNSNHTDYGLKRIGVKTVGDAVEAWERESGKPLHELENATFFSEELAERIRQIDPESATDEAHQHPDRFVLWREIASRQATIGEVTSTGGPATTRVWFVGLASLLLLLLIAKQCTG